MPLIEFTANGFYCPAGQCYIDPWRPVERAIITHAHSDHARWGHRHYLAHHLSQGMLRQRLGAGISLQTIGWNEPLRLPGVEISLHPAGHIIGSSMVRISGQGEAWLITGDYKLEDDGLSTAWEPVSCSHLVTECTFGLPVYQWKPQENIYREMRDWVAKNHAAGVTSVFFAYALGKAQRVMMALQPLGIPMWAHGAVHMANEALLSDGVPLPDVQRITADTPKSSIEGNIVLAPPSAAGTPWLKRLGKRETANCSGWMQVRGNQRRNSADRGFVLSDHADWPALLKAVDACEASHVFTTHGFTDAFSRYLREEKHLYSEPVATRYGHDDEDHFADQDEEDNTTNTTAPL